MSAKGVFKITALLGMFLAVSTAQMACGRLSKGHEKRGDEYYSGGYYDDSLAEYLMAQRKKGPSAELLRKIGRVYVRKGDFFQAKSYFDRYFNSIDLEPDSSILLDYFQIAVERGQAGDKVTKIKALEEILSIDPDYSLGPYFFDLAETFYEQADYARAIGYYLRGLPLELDLADRPTHLFRLAECYEKLNDWSNAFLYFDQFLTLYPGGPLAEQALWHRGNNSFPLANELLEKDELDQALFHADQIISVGQPQHYLDDAYFLRGEIMMRQERYEEARNAFRQVLRLNRYYYAERIADLARQRILEIDMIKRGD